MTPRTPDDARHQPQVGDVATLSDDGSTQTVMTVYDAPHVGWLNVRRDEPNGDSYTHGISNADWARDPYGVWSWTPGGAS